MEKKGGTGRAAKGMVVTEGGGYMSSKTVLAKWRWKWRRCTMEKAAKL